MIRLRVIDRDEEALVLSYHGGTEPVTDEAPMQKPRMEPEEVNAEVHAALVVSVMVGAPV